MTRSAPSKSRSGCPIATTLDIVGDRWSLVIVRDMIMGKARFGEFLKSPERIATSVLTDRLERLVAVGVVEARAYQDSPTRFEYRLTPMGVAMLPILQEVCRWANRFLPETWPAPESFMTREVSGGG